jgi:hypothetical protein
LIKPWPYLYIWAAAAALAAMPTITPLGLDGYFSGYPPHPMLLPYLQSSLGLEVSNTHELGLNSERNALPSRLTFAERHFLQAACRSYPHIPLVDLVLTFNERHFLEAACFSPSKRSSNEYGSIAERLARRWMYIIYYFTPWLRLELVIYALLII